MNKRISYIVISCSAFLLLFACSKNTLFGLYGECTDPYICNQLLINEDRSFTYYSVADIGGAIKTNGSWVKHKDTLILNSQPFSESCKMLVDEQESNTLEVIRVQIIDSLDGTMPFGTIELFSNGKRYSRNTDFDGNADFTIDKASIDSIFIYSPIQCKCVLKYVVNNASSNVFVVHHSYSSNYFMSNEKYLIKKNKVYFSQDSTGKFDKHYYYLKTTMDKKIW